MAYPRVAGHDWDRLAFINYVSTHSNKGFFDLESVTAGGGSSPTVTVHTDATGRVALKCAVSAQADISEMSVKIWELRAGQVDGTYRTEFDNSQSGQYHEFDVYLVLNDAAPEVSIWRIMDSGGVEIAKMLYNDGKWRTVVDGDTVDESVGTAAANTHYTVTVFYKAAKLGSLNSGDFRLWIDGVEITDVRQRHNEDKAWSEIRLGIAQSSTGSSGNEAWYNWHELMAESVLDEFDDFVVGSLRMRDRGLGHIREVGERWAAIFVHWNPAVHKSSWFAADDTRFRVYGHVLTSAGGAYTPSIAAPFGPLGTLNIEFDHCDIVVVDGLNPDLDYVFKIRCFREGDEAVDFYESDHDIRVKTRQTSRKTSYLIGVGHCQDQGQYQLHWRYWEDRNCREVWFVGDLFYNDRGGAESLPHLSDIVPASDTKELIQAYHNLTWDRFFAAYCRQGQMVFQADDRDYLEDDFQASYRKGTNDTRINPTGANGSKYEAGTLCDDPLLEAGGVTIATLWDQNRVGFKKYWGDGFAPSARGGNTANNQEHFRSFEAGDILFAVMDTRGYQDSVGTEPTSGGSASMIGSGQLVYWRNKFQNTQKSIVVILSGAAWCDLAGGDDNWKDISTTERILLEQDLENNPNISAVIIVCGDRHYTLIDRRRNDGQNSRSGFSFDKMVATVQIGPACRPVMPAYLESWETETDVLFAWDQDVPGGRYSQLCGTMLINENNNSMQLVVFSGIDNATAYTQTLTWEPCSPNRAIASATQMMVQEETIWSQAVTGGSATPYGIDFTSETFRSEKELSKPDSRLGVSGRMLEAPYYGNMNVVGTLRGELQPNGVWPLILKHALGAPTTSGSGAPYEHLFLGSNSLPAGLTFEKWLYFRDRSLRYFRYTGCKVDRLTMSVEQNQVVLMEADFLGHNEAEVTTPLANPNYALNNDPFTAQHGLVFFDLTGNRDRDPIGTVQTMSLDINNRLHGNAYGPAAGNKRRHLNAGQRMISGTARVMLTKPMIQLWEGFRDGTVLAIEWKFTRANISWSWFVPRITITGSPTPKTQGRGPSYIDIAFRASRDSIIGSDIRLTIRNLDPIISTFN